MDRLDKPTVAGVAMGFGIAACIALVMGGSPVSNYVAPTTTMRPTVGTLQRPLPLSARPVYQDRPYYGAQPFAQVHDEAVNVAAPTRSTLNPLNLGLLAPLATSIMGFAWIISKLIKPTATNEERIAMAWQTSKSKRVWTHKGQRIETPAEKEERQMRESQEVEARVVSFSNFNELQAKIASPPTPDHLFVIEIDPSDDSAECDTGLTGEQDYVYKMNQGGATDPCIKLRHTFVRTARNCPDTTFMSLVADGSPDSQAVMDRLEVKSIPSIVFIRGARVVWRHEGVVGADKELEEGIAFFGGGSDARETSDLIPDLHTAADVSAFAKPGASDDLLRVVLCLTTTAPQCLHIYPAMAAVAKDRIRSVSFARLLGDENATSNAALGELGVKFIPTMLVYNAKTGQEVARHVVASRGEFLVKFLEEADKFSNNLQH